MSEHESLPTLPYIHTSLHSTYIHTHIQSVSIPRAASALPPFLASLVLNICCPESDWTHMSRRSRRSTIYAFCWCDSLEFLREKWSNVCMYECINECMYVYMYICTYLCMYVLMKWKNCWKGACMYVCMYVYVGDNMKYCVRELNHPPEVTQCRSNSASWEAAMKTEESFIEMYVCMYVCI